MSEQPRAIGPYVLGEQVARDGSGRSYASEDPQTGRAVTVKVLRIATGDDPGAVESFERSVQAASELRHPAILRLLGHGEADGRRYLVMEERPGPDLYRVLKQRRLGLQQAFRAFRPIAEAVQAAHARGIVQGDLSPRTISVSDNLSVVKLTDLGLPREVVATGGRTLTSTAGGTGALHFIAPERAVDPLDTDPRADVYSTRSG
ncbi:MAG: protein kinase [Actinobacteria bacterium]|nr:protein kinase [Actinomycetota bacterium]